MSGHADDIGKPPLCPLTSGDFEVLIVCCRQYLEPEADWRKHGPFRYEVQRALGELRRYVRDLTGYEEAVLRHAEETDQPHC